MANDSKGYARLVIAETFCPRCGATRGHPCFGRDGYHRVRASRLDAKLRRDKPLAEGPVDGEEGDDE